MSLRGILSGLGDAWRLFRIAFGKHPWLLLGNFFLMLIVASIPFIISYSFGQIVNELVKISGTGSWTNILWTYVGLFVGLAVLLSLLVPLQTFLAIVLRRRLFILVELLVTGSIAELDVASHEDPGQQDLFTRVKENAVHRVPAFVERSIFMFQNLLEVMIALGVFLFAEPLVGIVVFASMLPRFWAEFKYGKSVFNVEEELSETRRKFWFNRYALIHTEALIEIKTLQAVPFFLYRLRELFSGIENAHIRNEFWNVLRQLSVILVAQAARAATILFFIWQVVEGNLLLGTLAFFLTSLNQLQEALTSFSRNLGKEYEDGMFVRDTFRLMDMEPRIASNENAVSLSLTAPPTIEFRDVSFKYPGKEEYVLKNVNFTIHPGETIGLVGKNGHGKTTLMKLLYRFYDPTDGVILVNGQDLRDIPVEEWHAYIGVLFQNFDVYSALTAGESIGLGRSYAGKIPDPQRVALAAASSDAASFIEKWELEYDTPLGRWFEKGESLSGGESQKIALARVFYREPLIMILDEPTSSIDSDAEREIFRRILKDHSGVTRFLISHRFSTLRNADRICVIHDGEIAELGTHEELMKLNGIYATRFNEQRNAYIDEAPVAE